MRQGYYVEGRRYSLEQHYQAVGRADFLENEYNRPVDIVRIGPLGERSVYYRTAPANPRRRAA